MIRYLVQTALAHLAREVLKGEGPDLTPLEAKLLTSIWEGLDWEDPSHRDLVEAKKRAWHLVVKEVASTLADGWDQYGAPTVAKYAPGVYFGHFTGPYGEGIVEASSKRQAYREARRRWIAALLGVDGGEG